MSKTVGINLMWRWSRLRKKDKKTGAIRKIQVGLTKQCLEGYFDPYPC